MGVTALACLPALAWAASASAQTVPTGTNSLNTLVAPQLALTAADRQAVPATPSYDLSEGGGSDPITAASSQSAEQSAPAGTPEPAGATRGAAPAAAGNDLAMKMTNPVTDLWLIEMEFNNLKLEKDSQSPVSGKWVNNFYLQPVLPVSLTKNLSLITRPVVTIYQSTPYPTGPGKTNRKTAFGDTILAQVVSPKLPQPWIFAAGPTWIFPTAGSELTGQGKWQLGPAVGGGVVTPKFMVAALVQQWWSFAGQKDRESTSQMGILPKVYAFWGEGWSVGYSGQIQVDWKASHGDRWTVPAGVAVGKVVKFGILPVQIRVGGQYFPIRPEFGPEWNFTVQITPLLPRLIKNAIFE